MNIKRFTAILLLGLGTISFLQAQTYEQMWNQVGAAEYSGKPQTAIRLSTDIFKKAEREKNSAQMMMAYINRADLRNRLTPDSFYVYLKDMERWAETADKPLDRAVLHSLIAGIYADYGENNRWQLRQSKDIVGEEPSSDIREWSGNMFVQQVLKHTHAALKDTALLLKSSTRMYLPFVRQGVTSNFYQHDMYHLLGTRALESLNKFINVGDDAVVRKEIHDIFQQMISVYQKVGNENGVMLLTLDYLDWQGQADGEAIPYYSRVRLRSGEVKETYQAELDSLIAKYQSKEICAEVYLAKAKSLWDKDRVKALQLCDEAIRLYPSYRRTNALKTLRQDILRPSLEVQTEETVYPGSESTLTIKHCNLSGFTVMYYRVNTANVLFKHYSFNDAFYQNNTTKLSEQHFSLAQTTDHQMADTVFTIKAPSAEGCYVMRIAPDTKANANIGQLLHVTRLTILSRTLPQRQIGFVVLDSRSGLPVPGATIALSNYNRTVLKTLTTDADGKVETKRGDNWGSMRAYKGADKWMAHQYVADMYYEYDKRDQAADRVELLTDRSLYRPGQTVYVKGIAYSQQLDTAWVREYKGYTVKLNDANDQEVGSNEVRTNGLGSFTTTFTLPAVCLNGNFRLQTLGGVAYIRVEEYKRPTFDITFDKLEGSYQLGDTVQVKGHAKTFSGVNMQDLEVSYVITRKSGFGWRYYDSSEVLDSGVTTLDAEGAFSVPVSLVRKSGEQRKGVNYRFQVEATLTNAAGETQSSVYSLSIGERSLVLEAELKDERICKDRPFKTTFKAMNLDGKPVEVEGTYTLYPVIGVKPDTYSAEAAHTGTFTSNRELVLTDWQSLPSSKYKLVLKANDAQGREVTEESEVVLFSAKDKRPPVGTTLWCHKVNTDFDTTHPAEFYFGSSLKDTYVLMTVLSENLVVENKTFMLTDSIARFDYLYKPVYGNGLTIDFCFVKDGRLYTEQVSLRKRVAEKNLTLKWEVFRDRLRPGQQEEWKLTVKTPQGTPADAEMLALMYDASLDKIWKNNQMLRLHYDLNLPYICWNMPYQQQNSFYYQFPPKRLFCPILQYDNFKGTSPWDKVYEYDPHTASSIKFTAPVIKKDEEVMEEVAVLSIADVKGNDEVGGKDIADMKMVRVQVGSVTTVKESDMPEETDTQEATPTLRTNFSETAFFYPQLRTNEEGEISFSFTMPESLTRWNFRGYAHTRGMLTGMLNGEATTSKEFMLTPNMSRFVRVGDKTSIAASVTNLTGNGLDGTVTLTLFDPMTETVISTQKQPFTAEAGKTTAVNFQFDASEKYEVLGCRLVADGGTFSDGEQHLLPVLSNKAMLIETVTMPVRGEGTKTFSLKKLFNDHSKTASNQQLTVEFTANPAWYAVQALTGLSQPTNDNAVSWATAYYANTLAAYVMNSQPRIKAVFDSWKLQGGSKDTFLSNLEKNQEVKNILLSESPWVMEAKNEQQQKERIATLFDLNTISSNQTAARTKLKELQLSDGSWSWYKGMYGSEYITTYIAGLNARLAELTGKFMEQGMLDMQTAALGYLDKQARKEYNALRKLEKEGKPVTGISGSAVDYLYVKALSNAITGNSDIIQYFLNKATQMVGSASMKIKAKLAVAFDKTGRKQDAQRCMESLKEYLAKSEELGMYFAFNEDPYSWNGQPIPAHVVVMEAFDRVAKDTETVEEMKLWLLKQKQTQQWDSPVSTADAVYALLERGDSPVDVQAGARITLADNVIDTDKSQMAGVGYIKETFTDKRSINAKEITVTKQDKGISWGAVYARFEEKTDKVKQQGGELNIEKKLYVERMVNNAAQLEPVTAKTRLAIGDKVTSRITIRTDRAMEFIQLKDQRGACFEPIGNLSGYRWSNGFSYYIDVKDASTNFFFDGLGKGVFILEYVYRVARTGTYNAGLATIQCAYAPEYASHSESMVVVSE